MKICVAGLGIIGGSLCLALKRAGYEVYGWNRSEAALSYALKNGIIDGKVLNYSDYDVVFVALPLEATLEFLDRSKFKDGAVVLDICGVKKIIEDKVYKTPRNYRYVGCHPMAGKEVSGIENACADLFDRASMVITHSDKTDSGALDTVRSLTEKMGFKYTVECSAATHDRKIAYTSQLAHIVSNAYVKDGEMADCIGFTGGSFQDMTRIAGVDENVWASLYLANAGNVSEKLENLIASLSEIKSAVDVNDAERLKKILKCGRLLFSGGNKFAQQKDITVTKNK